MEGIRGPLYRVGTLNMALSVVWVACRYSRVAYMCSVKSQ